MYTFEQFSKVNNNLSDSHKGYKQILVKWLFYLHTCLSSLMTVQ